jgi:integrase
MAAIHKRTRSKFWICQYRSADGRWLKVSTKLTDRQKAKMWCENLQHAQDVISRGSPSEVQLRHIISDTMERVTGRSLASPTVRQWFEQWLAGKTGATSEATIIRYRQAIRDLLDFLREKANARLESIDQADIIKFRDHLHAQGKTPATVNLAIGRIIAAAFRLAFAQGYIRRNPAAGVPHLADRDRRRKQAFTLDQVRALVAAADGEWEGVVLCGFVTGMRLGDVVTLRWECVDFDAGVLHFRQSKTQSSADEETIIGLHEDLRAYLERLRVAERQGFIFPTLAARRIAGSHGLSNEFSRIMQKAGITSPTIRERKGAGRTVRALSFHSLRHSAASHVFSGKVVAESVKSLTGHGRGQAHKHYLHVDLDAVKAASSLIPRLS